jgi:hypothetical protein
LIQRRGRSFWPAFGRRRLRRQSDAGGLATQGEAGGVLRVPVAVLQLTGALAAPDPTWYVGFQGLLGVVQFTIGLVMVAGHRRAAAGTAPGWSPARIMGDACRGFQDDR